MTAKPGWTPREGGVARLGGVYQARDGEAGTLERRGGRTGQCRHRAEPAQLESEVLQHVGVNGRERVVHTLLLALAFRGHSVPKQDMYYITTAFY